MNKIIIGFIVGFLIGAFSHEADIVRNCSENGESTYSSWITSIDCSIKED